MRDVSVHTGMLIWATLITFCLQISLTLALSEESPLSSKSDEESQGMDSEKRDWNKNLKMWGKRGWNNLHGGWGLKRNAPTWGDQVYSPPVVEKRAWQNMQTGWGKRVPSDDEYAIQRLASMLEEDMEPQFMEYGPDNEIEANDDEKRNWRQFSDGWGKRSKWEKFRGSWGKRDPAWSNLKGIWGKRSIPDQVAQ